MANQAINKRFIAGIAVIIAMAGSLSVFDWSKTRDMVSEINKLENDFIPSEVIVNDLGSQIRYQRLIIESFDNASIDRARIISEFAEFTNSLERAKGLAESYGAVQKDPEEKGLWETYQNNEKKIADANAVYLKIVREYISGRTSLGTATGRWQDYYVRSGYNPLYNETVSSLLRLLDHNKNALNSEIHSYDGRLRALDGMTIGLLIAGFLFTTFSASFLTAAQYRLERDQVEKINRVLEQRVSEELLKNQEKESMLYLKSRQASMGEMIGNITHQWKQPIAALSIAMQTVLMLAREKNLDAEILKKSASMALEVIDQMNQTVNDFNDFYRPDREKSEFTAASVIQRALILMKSALEKNGIAVETGGGDIAVYGFPNQLVQVLVNIIANARDNFHERKTPSPRIAIHTESEGGNPVIKISDNGGGIPADIIGRIFDPYFTTKDSGKGSGIGLYLSKTIVEKNMGGKLTAANDEEGAVFVMELRGRPA